MNGENKWQLSIQINKNNIHNTFINYGLTDIFANLLLVLIFIIFY